MSTRQRRGGGLSFYIILLVGIIFVAMFLNQGNRGADLTYSELIEQIQVGNVENAKVSGSSLELTFKNPVQNNKAAVKQVSPYWMEDLLSELKTAEATSDTTYDYVEPLDFGMWFNLILLVMLFGSMAFFIYMMFARQGGDGKGAMNFGKSRARVADPTKNTVTFKDVAGADEEKAELQEVVEFLKNSQKYERLGATIPRGILLVGPPGTGKTLLAKAVAGEAGVPFYSISGSDFVEMYVGVGASRVRDLFQTAKKNSPSIIFIDEIDAVGRKRGAGLGGSHDEREQTLNQLLVEMDGFGPNEESIIIAATNRADILDPALLRPGRFDRRVIVQRPDINGREEILRVHARKKPLADDVDLKEIARVTPGFTGADLANLLNEAALFAARQGKSNINYEDISESVFKVMLGPEKKSRVISEKERYLTAYHEAGHALVLRTVSETDRVERVSIIPAGGAGGYTAHKPHEDVYFQTKSQLIADIKVALGGRAAEQIIFGEVSTGASGDLNSLNQTAREIVTTYGMSDTLPNLVFGSDQHEVFLGRDYGQVQNYSDKISEQIDQEVAKIISDAYEHVLQILNEKRHALDALVETLLVKEKIEGEEFEKIYIENTTPEQRKNDAKNEGLREIYGFKRAKSNEDKQSMEPMAEGSDSMTSSSEEPAIEIPTELEKKVEDREEKEESNASDSEEMPHTESSSNEEKNLD